MNLFSPKWKSKNPNKRIKWINGFNPSNLKNLDTLQYLMKDETDENVKAAIEKRVIELAMDENHDVYIFAIEKLASEEKLLREIIHKSQNRHVKVLALLKLNDQKLMADELLKTNGGIDDYVPLINKFTDKNEQRRAITTHTDKDSRIEMVNYLNNYEILAEIAQNDPSSSVRIEAIYKMTEPNYDETTDSKLDNNVLTQIVLNDPDNTVAKEAASKITDPAQIIEVVKASNNDDIIKHAITSSKFKKRIIEKITDELFLSRFIMYNTDFDTDYLVKLYDKITNQDLKGQILYRKYSNKSFSNRVFENFNIPFEDITNEKILFFLAVKSQDEEFTNKVLAKINNEELLLKLINLKGHSEKIFNYLISRIDNNYQILSEVFKKNKEYNIQKLVIENVQDKESFVKLLINKNKKDKFNALENEILEKIDDEEIFVFIAENAKLKEIKELALIKISNEEIITELLKKYPYKEWDKEYGSESFFTLLARVENEDTLFGVVISQNDWKSKMNVLKAIHNEKVFKRVKEALKETEEFKEAARKNQPKEWTWKTLTKELMKKTNVSNPRIGEIKWNYGNNQTEIVASYGLWNFKSTLNPISNAAHLDITHKLFNYSKSISAAENEELSHFLYKIF